MWMQSGALAVLAAASVVIGCTGSEPSGTAGTAGSGSGAAGAAAAGTSGAAGVTGGAGRGGGAGTTGAAGTTGGAGATGRVGSAGVAGTTGIAGTTGGAGAGTDAGTDAAGSGSAGVGAAGAGGVTGTAGAGPSFVPAGYTGTPFAALKIPGRINAADYDRGGAGVAWCHNAGACASGTVTGDWYPAGSAPYRPPIPANAQICSGAACNDNVGVCRMSPNKPDNLVTGQPAPAADTYLCYSIAGEWTKYTVVVTEAATYAVGGFMAVPQGGGVNLSFGASITTGNLALAITSTANSGSGENYHSWEQRENLATVTFPAAGTYLMTLTQVGRFNADSFTFTKK